MLREESDEEMTRARMMFEGLGLMRLLKRKMKLEADVHF
jgi:hypothetical protein